MARPVCPQLQKCSTSPGSYAWCQFRTFAVGGVVKAKRAIGYASQRCWCSNRSLKPTFHQSSTLTVPGEITYKLASYGAAKRETMPGIEHRQHKGLSNRGENSHQPTRRRERQMKQFKSPGQPQRFLSNHESDQQPVPSASRSRHCRRAPSRQDADITSLGRNPQRYNRKRTLYIAQSRDSLTTAEQVDGARVHQSSPLAQAVLAVFAQR